MSSPSSAGLMFKLSQETTAYVNQMVASGRSRDLEVTIALAMVASTLLTVPSGPVPDPEAYYRTQAGVLSINMVNAVNGMMSVDYRLALELCHKLYAQRYEMATMPFQSFSVECSEGTSCLFGLTKHLPAFVLECMNANSKTIVRHYRALEAIKCAYVEV